jgi:putative copper export protein
VEFYRLTIVLHLIGAAIWVGGHLVLTLAIFPEALRSHNASIVRQFDARFERIGIPALALQVITGLFLVARWIPNAQSLISPATPQAWSIDIKLALLLATVIIAAHARLRIVPVLDESNLRILAYHAYAVTLIGIGMLIMGVVIRTGGFL